MRLCVLTLLKLLVFVDEELFEENSKCIIKMLINKLNSLIKEIHQKEDDSELEIPEIISEEN